MNLYDILKMRINEPRSGFNFVSPEVLDGAALSYSVGEFPYFQINILLSPWDDYLLKEDLAESVKLLNKDLKKIKGMIPRKLLKNGFDSWQAGITSQNLKFGGLMISENAGRIEEIIGTAYREQPSLTTYKFVPNQDYASVYINPMSHINKDEWCPNDINTSSPVICIYNISVYPSLASTKNLGFIDAKGNIVNLTEEDKATPTKVINLASIEKYRELKEAFH